MILSLKTDHTLLVDETYDLPLQEHWKSRGHQVHVDLTRHRDPNLRIAVAFEVSTDGGKTWAPGGSVVFDGGGTLLDKEKRPFTHGKAWFGHETMDQEPCVRRLIRGVVRVSQKRLRKLQASRQVTTNIHLFGVEGSTLDRSLEPY